MRAAGRTQQAARASGKALLACDKPCTSLAVQSAATFRPIPSWQVGQAPGAAEAKQPRFLLTFKSVWASSEHVPTMPVKGVPGACSSFHSAKFCSQGIKPVPAVRCWADREPRG